MRKTIPWLGLAMLVITPNMMASNMITARLSAGIIEPNTLAFLRWSIAGLLLSGLFWLGLRKHLRSLRAEWRTLTVLGFLGMVVCGPPIYIGAQTTSGTNIGLIYAMSPAMIIVLDHLFYRTGISLRRWVGVAVCFAGVLVVLSKGTLDTIRHLTFTEGDLWILLSATGWALYSVRSARFRPDLPQFTRIAAIALFGAVLLIPGMVNDLITRPLPVFSPNAVMLVAILVFFSALGGYLGYAKAQKELGPQVASLIMYLTPISNSILAWLILGEGFFAYHWLGAVMIIPGVFIASFQFKR